MGESHYLLRDDLRIMWYQRFKEGIMGEGLSGKACHVILRAVPLCPPVHLAVSEVRTNLIDTIMKALAHCRFESSMQIVTASGLDGGFDFVHLEQPFLDPLGSKCRLSPFPQTWSPA